MGKVNSRLAGRGAKYRAVVAEYITADAKNGGGGGTVIANDRGNKRLGADFIPRDQFREWTGSPTNATAITFAIDANPEDAAPVGVSTADALNAIRRAMRTWDAVQCSTLDLTESRTFGLDIGVVEFILTSGAEGAPFVFADVMHGGWVDINALLDIPAEADVFILGITFTFTWVDENGVETDMDNNGLPDVAFREIYYNSKLPGTLAWRTNGNIDIESIALHEAGHGLSQGHFGKISITKDGFLKASPRAVMNALYGGPQRKLLGTDNGGHCGNWASWPNK
jgi:hypothetical protein